MGSTQIRCFIAIRTAPLVLLRVLAEVSNPLSLIIVNILVWYFKDLRKIMILYDPVVFKNAFMSFSLKAFSKVGGDGKRGVLLSGGLLAFFSFSCFFCDDPIF